MLTVVRDSARVSQPAANHFNNSGLQAETLALRQWISGESHNLQRATYEFFLQVLQRKLCKPLLGMSPAIGLLS